MSSINEIIKNHPQLLVDFYADWCEPCKWLNPILEELQLILPDLKIHKVNIDHFPDDTVTFEIKSVPVMILFVDGKQVWRMNGFKYARELAKELKQFI
ncbi:MAG TPA: thioredoxin family protein [Bacteroidia bacterium]|nr:thioredoxin family protein [Bacteroidia bacterium]HMU20126.1 thioredoxin family protein [Bacteroidia bacterium]